MERIWGGELGDRRQEKRREEEGNEYLWEEGKIGSELREDGLAD